MQSSLHVDGTLVPGIPFSAPPLLSGILCLNVSVPLQKVFVATIKTNHGQQQPGWTTIGNWRRNTFVHLMIRGQDACQMWQQRIWMHIVGCLHEKGGRTHKRGSKEWRGVVVLGTYVWLKWKVEPSAAGFPIPEYKYKSNKTTAN